MALEIAKTLFSDNMVVKCGKFYKDGIQKSNKKSWTGGLWSYFLTYSTKLIDETKSWNTFIENLNFPENSFLSCLIYFVEHNLNGAKRVKKLNPVIVSATIVDMGAVIRKIKETWTIFTIKEVKIDLKSQRVCFKVYGKCYIPEKYRSYVLMTWSATQTEECNYFNEIDEKYAQEKELPLTAFINNGIMMEIV